MKRHFVLLLFYILSLSFINAQEYYFYVQFKYKNNTVYTLNNPSEYLSQRAIARRDFFNIAIDSTDLPVNESYVSQIQSLNIRVHSRTKWMNGVTVALSDSSKMSSIRNLNYVKFTQYTGKSLVGGLLVGRQKFPNETMETNYGSAAAQINQLNGVILHNNGYRGQGMVIAVIDAGFNNVNVNSGFDSLRNEGRLLGVKNFVNPAQSVYAEHAHGANVLSFMAGNILNSYVGTAPKASYWLLQSEANNTETLTEPDLWVSAIEFADSVGADVSNTSLGYTTFDEPSMNFTYSDLNGKTSRASKAATMAVEKGILVFNSAGNEGNKTWKYIGVPADADKIITVGSVTSTGVASAFSSFGPSSDGRLKPELSARGSSAPYISTNGSIASGSGTSYASPILAGISTCFLQAAKAKRPNLGLNEIKNMMYRSANLFSSPTTQMGYGIPNFESAYNELISLTTNNPEMDNVKIHVNSGQKKLFIEIDENITNKIKACLINSFGRRIEENTYHSSNFDINIQSLQTGIYILSLNFNGKTVNKKIVVQ